MSQYPLFSDPHWVDAWHVGDRVTSSHTNNTGVIEIVKPGRYLLIRWALPTPHATRHHSPLGLVKGAEA